MVTFFFASPKTVLQLTQGAPTWTAWLQACMRGRAVSAPELPFDPSVLMSSPLSPCDVVLLALGGRPVGVPPLGGLQGVSERAIHLVQGNQSMHTGVWGEGQSCDPALYQLRSSPIGDSPYNPDCQPTPPPTRRASPGGGSSSSEGQSRSSPSPCCCAVSPSFGSFRLPPDFDLGSMSPPGPTEHPNSRPQPQQGTHPLQHTHMTHEYPLIRHSPHRQQSKARSFESGPSSAPSLKSSLTLLQSFPCLYHPPGQPCLQGSHQSDPRTGQGPQTLHTFHAQPAQHVDDGQMIALNVPCSSSYNRMVTPSEPAARADHSPAPSPGPTHEHSPAPSHSSRPEHNPAPSHSPRAEHSPAPSPATTDSCMPAARQGPRIKTTIRIGRPGQIEGPAVKVVATGRVLTPLKGPKAMSPSPNAQSPAPQSTPQHPAGKLASPEASVSGTTVTAGQSGSCSPMAVVRGKRGRQLSAGDLDCSETLEAESASFQQQSGIGINTADNVHRHPSIQSSAAINVSPSELLTQAAATEHESLAASPAALTAVEHQRCNMTACCSSAMLAGSPDQAPVSHHCSAHQHRQTPNVSIIRQPTPNSTRVLYSKQQVLAAGVSCTPAHAAALAVAAAGDESAGGEAVEDWAPDADAIQAASALAGMAESAWAGKSCSYCVYCRAFSIQFILLSLL